MSSRAPSSQPVEERIAALWASFDRPSVALPLLLGAGLLLLAGSLATADRLGALYATFFGALALIGLGVLLYLLVGIWVWPASMVVTGLALYAGHQVIASFGVPLPLPAIALGGLGVLGIADALRASRRPIEELSGEPRA